ncbi:hypothetical protein LIA77_00378 [Sarocladium implicatum]|nr:hypothetical protein LIA77_00378 [Sarocladium implicatum]
MPRRGQESLIPEDDGREPVGLPSRLAVVYIQAMMSWQRKNCRQKTGVVECLSMFRSLAKIVLLSWIAVAKGSIERSLRVRWMQGEANLRLGQGGLHRMNVVNKVVGNCVGTSVNASVN